MILKVMTWVPRRWDMKTWNGHCTHSISSFVKGREWQRYLLCTSKESCLASLCFSGNIRNDVPLLRMMEDILELKIKGDDEDSWKVPQKDWRSRELTYISYFISCKPTLAHLSPAPLILSPLLWKFLLMVSLWPGLPLCLL